MAEKTYGNSMTSRIQYLRTYILHKAHALMNIKSRILIMIIIIAIRIRIVYIYV